MLEEPVGTDLELMLLPERRRLIDGRKLPEAAGEPLLGDSEAEQDDDETEPYIGCGGEPSTPQLLIALFDESVLPDSCSACLNNTSGTSGLTV